MLRLRNAATLLLVLGSVTGGNLRSAETKAPSDNPLEQRVTLNFNSVPLPEAAATIAQKFGLNLVIDVKDVTAAGKSPEETRLVINVVNVPLDDALTAMLKPHGLSHVMADEVLKITGQATTRLFVETYSVPDLVASPSVAKGQPVTDRDALQQLAKFLKSVVVPDSWHRDGEGPLTGPGALIVNEETCSFVVRQTQEVHQQLRDVLDQLRLENDVRILADIKVITVPAEDLNKPATKLLQAHTLTVEEQQAWTSGEHSWSGAPVLQWAELTLLNGQFYRMTSESSLAYRVRASEDRRSVLMQIHDIGDKAPGSPFDNIQTVIIPDGHTTMIPLRRGRFPLVDKSGSACVVVVTPKIRVTEEAEELLSGGF